jgi:hypothetical protein
MTDEIDDYYIQEYNEAFEEIKRDLDSDEYHEIMKTMVSDFNQKHSDDGKADAHKNFIRAQNSLRGGGGLSKEYDDFIDYCAKTDNKPKSEVRAWAKSVLREINPLRRYKKY